MCLIPRLTGILLDRWGARSVELVPGPTMGFEVMGSRSDDLVVTSIASQVVTEVGAGGQGMQLTFNSLQ